jgi:hypothetical protein
VGANISYVVAPRFVTGSLLSAVTAAPTPAPPSVPFWLQVATVALAPILGFMGVAVGVLMKERSDRRMGLRQDRLEVYRGFLRALAELEKLVAVDGSAAYGSRDEEEKLQYLKALNASYASINALYTEIDLVGSPKAAVIARAVFNLDTETEGGNFDGYKVADSCRKIISRFRNVAMRDLGVPRRQRKRTPEKVFTEVALGKLKAELGIAVEVNDENVGRGTIGRMDHI